MQKHIKHLKQRAHHLKPVVTLGQHGFSDNVQQEIEAALNAHELIKIKIASEDRAEFVDVCQQICQRHQAELIDQIGRVAVIYRKRED